MDCPLPDDIGPKVQAFNENTYVTKESFWESRVREVALDGVMITNHEVCIFEEVSVRTTGVEPLPGLIFTRRGRMETRLPYSDSLWSFSDQEHNFFYNTYAAEATFFSKQECLDLFILNFLPSKFLQLAEGNGRLLETMAENMVKAEAFSLAPNRNLSITPIMSSIIDNILHCPYTGSSRKLFLESKVLELLALQCAQYEEAKLDFPKIKLSKADIKKLHFVREIIVSDISQTPTLTALAKASGLNEFKLKAGFKQLFRQTVFSFLSDCRLDHARKTIQNTELSLTDIAFASGFASIHHFSFAFKKKFGSSPSKYRN